METKTYKNPLIWFSNDITIKYGDCICACDTPVFEPERLSFDEKIEWNDVRIQSLQTVRLKKDLMIVRNPDFGTGITIINNKTLDFISTLSGKSLEKQEVQDFLRVLLQRGIVSHKNMEYKQTQTTLSAWLHITNQCNFNCSYCYLKKSNESMSEATARQVLQQIFNRAVAENKPEVRLKFAGGEPLLHLKTVLSIQNMALQLAKKHRITLTSVLLTNGALLNEKTIAKLQKNNFVVMVSVDGLADYHNKQRHANNGSQNFPALLNQLGELHRQNMLTDISITISDKNSAGLPEFVNYCLNKNYPFNFNFYRQNENSVKSGLTFTNDTIIKYLKQTYRIIEKNLPDYSLLNGLLDRVNLTFPHQYTCSADRNYMVFDQNGDRFQCQMQISNNTNERFTNLPVSQKTECNHCEIRNYCTGGCPLMAYKTGNTRGKSPYCDVYKALYKEVLKLEAQRILKYEKPHCFN